MFANAVVMQGPRDLEMTSVALKSPQQNEAVVQIKHSGISTGTEKLFWSGEMPPFPGMGYPLVPGYEAFGEIVELSGPSEFAVGDHVFVPGANCYSEAFGLFGGCFTPHLRAQRAAARPKTAAAPLAGDPSGVRRRR